MDSVMLLPAEKENGHVNPSRITMLLSRLQFGAKMNVLMGLMLQGESVNKLLNCGQFG